MNRPESCVPEEQVWVDGFELAGVEHGLAWEGHRFLTGADGHHHRVACSRGVPGGDGLGYRVRAGRQVLEPELTSRIGRLHDRTDRAGEGELDTGHCRLSRTPNPGSGQEPHKHILVGVGVERI